LSSNNTCIKESAAMVVRRGEEEEEEGEEEEEEEEEEEDTSLAPTVSLYSQLICSLTAGSGSSLLWSESVHHLSSFNKRNFGAPKTCFCIPIS
jgi:hypothetical protein